MQKKLDEFAPVELRSDITHLSTREIQMLPYLFDAAQIMDDLFWLQAFGSKEEFLDTITDKATFEFALVNYGPWERLNDNKPFIGCIPRHGQSYTGGGHVFTYRNHSETIHIKR